MLVRALAALVLGLEAVGLLALVAFQLSAVVSGDTTDPATAWALIVMTLLAAAALFAFGAATVRDVSWGRSGGIVIQVLILAIALGALTGVGADPLVAGAIALPGVIGGVLLVLAVRDAAPRADGPDGEAS
ncbi:histidine kinase [Microbacterium sp. P05]|uniref:histidine kinase n=1 Tax=Microbacterium sp. P05 TaxID=3366948 RepID=UPI0037469E28